MVAWAALYRKEAFDGETCSRAIDILSGNDSGIRKNDPIYARFPELLALARFELNTLAVPDAVLFIDTAPSTALRRIEERGEHRQAHETEEKLAELRRAYMIVCDSLRQRRNDRVIVLDGEAGREEVALSARNFIEGMHRTENPYDEHTH